MPNFDQLLTFFEKYFPGKLSENQLKQFRIAFTAYLDWNTKVNLISRKDLENLAERHFLHSLSIAKCIQFTPGTRILDVGTGGGFPGIPLAIFFPECQFHLVDSIQKKIRVVQDISEQAGLENVIATAQRAESINGQFDFVVSRAVAALPKFIPWVQKQIHCRSKNSLANGILYLKGMSVEQELEEVRKTSFPGKNKMNPPQIMPLDAHFEESFFSSKCLVHIPFCK